MAETTDELRKRAEDARSRGASAIQVKWGHVLALLDELDALRPVGDAAKRYAAALAAYREQREDRDAREALTDAKHQLIEAAALARHKEAAP